MGELKRHLIDRLERDRLKRLRAAIDNLLVEFKRSEEPDAIARWQTRRAPVGEIPFGSIASRTPGGLRS